MCCSNDELYVIVAGGDGNTAEVSAGGSTPQTHAVDCGNASMEIEEGVAGKRMHVSCLSLMTGSYVLS